MTRVSDREGVGSSTETSSGSTTRCARPDRHPCRRGSANSIGVPLLDVLQPAKEPVAMPGDTGLPSVPGCAVSSIRPTPRLSVHRRYPRARGLDLQARDATARPSGAGAGVVQQALCQALTRRAGDQRLWSGMGSFGCAAPSSVANWRRASRRPIAPATYHAPRAGEASDPHRPQEALRQRPTAPRPSARRLAPQLPDLTPAGYPFFAVSFLKIIPTRRTLIRFESSRSCCPGCQGPPSAPSVRRRGRRCRP